MKLKTIDSTYLTFEFYKYFVMSKNQSFCNNLNDQKKSVKNFILSFVTFKEPLFVSPNC